MKRMPILSFMSSGELPGSYGTANLVDVVSCHFHAPLVRCVLRPFLGNKDGEDAPWIVN